MPLGDRSREAVGKLPATVRALGWTSFLTDLSSEAIYPLLPNFVKALGGSAIDVGLLAGIASAVARLFAGGRWWPACSPSPCGTTGPAPPDRRPSAHCLGIRPRSRPKTNIISVSNSASPM